MPLCFPLVSCSGSIQMKLRAVIDVGTNSVKVLLGQVSGKQVIPEWETSQQTRLGQGFYESHRLQSGPIDATAAVVARFAREAVERGAESVRVIATSAAREALNADELLQAIHGASGLECQIIPGSLEAEWGFLGVTSNPKFAARQLLILDVGGGSTEFIVGHGDHAAFSESFPLGSVRLFERFQPSDSPTPKELETVRFWLREYLRNDVAPKLQATFERSGIPQLAVGIGGTTSLLALIHHQRRQFDRDLIENTEFDFASLRSLNEFLWGLPLARRREVPGLPPERADVILTGSSIYEAILDVFGIPTLGISTRGLRFAALLDTVPSQASNPPATS